jgi:mono/diheme cytochrome c family protein
VTGPGRFGATVLALVGLTVAGLAVASFSGCGDQTQERGVIVLPGMVRSIPYDAYDTFPIPGREHLTPPVGTIPYGSMPFDYGPEPSEARRAGRELASPLDGTAAQLARGKSVYDVFCAVCHGATGVGDGPIIGRFPNPPSLLADSARARPDGQLFHIITRGQGIMPSYAAQVRPMDRWRAILHVRALQGMRSAPDAAGDGQIAEDGP